MSAGMANIAPAHVESGYTCACGTFHKYPPYVYAHYDETLRHTCDACNQMHTICHGIATPIADKPDFLQRVSVAKRRKANARKESE